MSLILLGTSAILNHLPEEFPHGEMNVYLMSALRLVYLVTVAWPVS